MRAVRFGQFLYTLAGLYILFSGILSLLEADSRAAPILFFGIFDLVLVVVSITHLKKRVLSLIALTMLNTGFFTADIYAILGEEYSWSFDRINTAVPSILIVAFSLVLFILLWRRGQEGAGF